ncbi:MAG: HDOD domain-containing protein [Candidatus Helarchaeota archaeon]|nr:HDOD domain-containing protein [Candidatus Helarchaeota archaeon]
MKLPDEKASKIKKIIGLVNNSEISSIKHTVMELIKIIDNPSSSAKDLKNIIEIDPPLTAKLLKLTNSAYYGFRRKISEIQEAIVYIGFDDVKELALRQKVCELFESNDYLFGYTRISLWKHSVAVALCSKLIYRREFRERGENIYATGLLHDIGVIVLDQFLHPRFVDILKKSKNEKNNLVNTESALLGFNHADIGAAIAKDWGFPDEMVKAIRNHHNLDSVIDEYTKSTLTTYIANYICQTKSLGYDDSPYKDKNLFYNCLKKLKIKEVAIELIIDEVKKNIGKMEEAGWF